MKEKTVRKSIELLPMLEARKWGLLPDSVVREDDFNKEIDRGKLRKRLSKSLHMLTPREEKVIKMRFGLDDGSEYTLEEVGLSFAVTRERIRQIEARTLRKLRGRYQGSRELKAFLFYVDDGRKPLVTLLP